MPTMSVTAEPTAPADVEIPTERIYRLSVAQYHAMARHGILEEDAPVELLEGWLVQKMTKHPPHTLTTGLVRRALERVLPSGWHVKTQEPITTLESEPEPDASVVRGDLRDYGDRHPGPRDVALIVEVADTSLRQDRGPKKRIYARARIPVYWIANLVERQFEVYTAPAGPTQRPNFTEHQEYGPEGELPVVLDGKEVGRLLVRDLLP
jgi:Uma2 family endonuclease